MTPNTKIWLHGLGAAFIGAAASSIGPMLVAPDRFNLTSVAGLRSVALASIISGVVSAAAYLKTSPLPPLLGPGDKATVQNPIIGADGTITGDSATLTKAPAPVPASKP